MLKNRSAWMAFIAVSTAALFYWLQYLTSILPSLTVRELMTHFSASGVQIGFINATYFYTFFIFLFICGPIIDRFSARWIAGFACLVCAITTYTTTVSHNIDIAYVSRATMGAASAFSYPLMLYLIKEMFNSRWFTLIASVYTASAEIFILIFNLFIATLLLHTPLQYYHIGLGIIGIIFAVLCFILISDQKSPASKIKKNHTQYYKKIPLLFLNFQYLKLLLITLFFFVPIALFSASWGVEFLKSALHFSKAQASVINSCLFGGLAVGTIFFGLLADWLSYRKWQIIISALLTAILLRIIIFIHPLNFYIACLLYFSMAFLSGATINVYYYAKSVCDDKIVATSIAVVTAISNISYMVIPPVVGWILDHSWQGTLQHGARIYTHSAYQTSFVAAPVCLLIVCFLAFFLSE